MALVTGAASYPTLTDMAARMDPDGSVAPIVEVLMQMNGVIADANFREGNLPTGNQHTVRVGLPKPGTRRFYEPVKAQKSITRQVTETAAMLEVWSELDAAEADLWGSAESYRATEDKAFIQAFENEVARLLFHGNEAISPAEFTGLSPRYNDIGSGAPETKAQIFDGGGTGSDNRSIWIVGWGDAGTSGLLPKGSRAGLQMVNHGLQTKESWDGSGNSEGMYDVYRTKYTWHLGLMVKDWRANARICNLPKGKIAPGTPPGSDKLDTSSAPFDRINELMIRALAATNRTPGVRKVIYCDQDTWTAFRIAAMKAVNNSTLTVEQYQGVPLVSFDGVPIKVCDALNANEARVA